MLNLYSCDQFNLFFYTISRSNLIQLPYTIFNFAKMEIWENCVLNFGRSFHFRKVVLSYTPSVAKYKTPFNFAGQRGITLTMICAYNMSIKLVYSYMK